MRDGEYLDYKLDGVRQLADRQVDAVRNPAIVPIMVLAVAKAFVLLKNETINRIKDVHVAADSRISPNILRRAPMLKSSAVREDIYFSQHKGEERHYYADNIGAEDITRRKAAPADRR